jgi:hypothetical protein
LNYGILGRRPKNGRTQPFLRQKSGWLPEAIFGGLGQFWAFLVN